jgi:5-methylcytosine-specific restriction endonuclease McrA
MTKATEFNQELYYLGRICKFNHIFGETNNGLRQKSNRTCLVCQKDINNKYKKANGELCNLRTRLWRKKIAQRSNVDLPAEKKCIYCDKLKPAKEFYQVKYSADGLLGHCKICDAKKQSDARAKRRKPKTYKAPELVKENRRKIKRRYKKTLKGKIAKTRELPRRRARILEVQMEKYTPTQIIARFADFENECAYCGSKEKLSIDHFIPVSKKGADCLFNIVPACIKCNSSKYNKHPETWFKNQPFSPSKNGKGLLAK